MIARARTVFLLGLSLSLCAMSRAEITAQEQLVPVEIALNPANFVHDNTVIEGVDIGSGDPEFTLRFSRLWATFGRRTTIPWDWSAYNGFAVVFENLENVPVVVGMRVDFTSNPGDPTRRQSEKYVLAPRAVQRVVLEIDRDMAAPWGIRGLPPGYEEAHARLFGTNAVDRRATYMWLVSLNQALPARVKVREIRAIQNTVNMNGIIDDFGQTSDRDWPGKVASSQDLQDQLAAEISDLNANPGHPFLYGNNAPAGAVIPGRWNVVKLPSGKWYLVTPNGKLFWSFGITTVGWDNGATPLAGRESLFQSLPPNSGATAAHYVPINIPGQGQALGFNYLSYNIARKYGVNWQTDYLTHALRRVRSWGFNTLGDWSHPDLYAASTIPYVIGVNTDDFPARITAPFRDFRLLPDAFDPTFQDWLTQKLRQRLAPHNGRPEFMGVFIDVELKWYDPANPATRYQAALAALNAPPGSPAKTAFLNRLKSKYRTITRFNNYWRTALPSWNSLNAANALPNPTLATATVADLKAFSQQYAAAYYAKVRAAIQAAGCTGLFFGSRDWFAPPEFIAQANRFVDVFSVAQYSNQEFMDWSFPLLTRPLLISEMSFGASDRGSWHPGPVSCFDQRDRANKMLAYFQKATTSSQVVGAHWFQYADMHPTGRNDGENYNMGFVSITDTPYMELVEVSRIIGASVYAWRGQ